MRTADKSFREKITFGFPANAIQMTFGSSRAARKWKIRKSIEREEQERVPGSKYFLARLFTSVFPNATCRHIHIFFFSFFSFGPARARSLSLATTHLRGEKRVARASGH